MTGKTIAEIQVGDSASYVKKITDADVHLYAMVSGDFNPLHLDEAFAKTTPFGTRVAHGMLSASLFSTILGTKLPGEGSIYLSQELKFVKPVYLNDTITATVTVSHVYPEKNRIVLDTVAVNQNDEPVVKGHAVMMPAK